MFGQRLDSHRIKAASISAVVAATMLAGAPMAIAASDSLKSSTAITTPGTVAYQAYPGGFADVVEQLRPTVVSVDVTREMTATPAGMEETPHNEFFERFFNDRNKRFWNGPRGHDGRQDPRGEMKAAGSGFFVDADGYIVTNNHVVAGAKKILVTLYNGNSYDAELIGRDPKTDLALIKIDADEELTVAEFGDPDEVRVGDWVIAVGNPFGLDSTVTTGIVSSRGRSIGAGPYDDFLQIDAAINRGNSGGPAFNTKGQVIGVNTAIFSPSGGSVGIGFAIPADMTQDVIADLKAHGKVVRGWLGIQIQAVTDDLAEGFGLAEAKGAVITEVIPEGPASDAGFEAGDVVVAVEGEAVETMRDLPRMIARLDAGESTKITVWRRGKERTLTVTIGKYPEAEQMAGLDDAEVLGEQTVLGLKLAKLDDSARASYNIDQDIGGVVITEVALDSWANRKGLAPGDVILTVSFGEVTSPTDVVAAIDAAEEENQRTVLILVSRHAQERFVALPLRDA